jgi:hypothetical protein
MRLVEASTMTMMRGVVGEGLGALEVGGKCLGSLDFPCDEGLTEGKGRGGRKGK